MKKILLISLLSGLVLAGCSGKGKKEETTSSSNSSSSSSLVSSSSDPEETSKLREQFKDAMTNENANFPQLSTEVAEDEAEVKLVTTEGDIRIKLFPKQAPLAVENFLTHAKEGNGTGGESIWKGKDKSKDSGNGFKNEYSPYLYNIRGALSMANAGPDTNGSQFFINQSKKDLSSQMSTDSFPAKIIEAYKNGGNPTLDGGAYTVFGQVLEGMDVADKIAAAETDDNDKPKKDIKIEKIEIIKDYDFSK